MVTMRRLDFKGKIDCRRQRKTITRRFLDLSISQEWCAYIQSVHLHWIKLEASPFLDRTVSVVRY